MRIAELDEMTYRRQLWDHRPLTAFWRVGRGVSQRLAAYGIETMGQIARLSLQNEELLYSLFGVNAELLIDHAWGWEPCTISMVKAYRPESNSLSSGQVLQSPYDWARARIVIQEMADAAALNLVAKRLTADQVVLTVGYDRESLTRPEIRDRYRGEVTVDYYGRMVPKHAQGTETLEQPTSSSRLITKATLAIYDRVVNRDLLVRRLNLALNHVRDESLTAIHREAEQLDLFTDYEALERERRQEADRLARERRIQEAQIEIKRRFGKNAILKGLSFEEGATARERNAQIGGHRA